MMEQEMSGFMKDVRTYFRSNKDRDAEIKASMKLLTLIEPESKTPVCDQFDICEYLGRIFKFSFFHKGKQVDAILARIAANCEQRLFLSTFHNSSSKRPSFMDDVYLYGSTATGNDAERIIPQSIAYLKLGALMFESGIDPQDRYLLSEYLQRRTYSNFCGIYSKEEAANRKKLFEPIRFLVKKYRDAANPQIAKKVKSKRRAEKKWQDEFGHQDGAECCWCERCKNPPKHSPYMQKAIKLVCSDFEYPRNIARMQKIAMSLAKDLPFLSLDVQRELGDYICNICNIDKDSHYYYRPSLDLVEANCASRLFTAVGTKSLATPAGAKPLATPGEQKKQVSLVQSPTTQLVVVVEKLSTPRKLQQSSHGNITPRLWSDIVKNKM